MVAYPEKILILTQPIEIATAEGEGAKVLVDHIQQVLR